jgi:hypothetical protein
MNSRTGWSILHTCRPMYHVCQACSNNLPVALIRTVDLSHACRDRPHRAMLILSVGARDSAANCCGAIGSYVPHASKAAGNQAE